jgi:hypothetical protein
MLLTRLVVPGESLLHRLAGDFDRYPPALADVGCRRLEHGQGSAGVAVGLDRHRFERLGIHLEPKLAESALPVAQCALQQDPDRVRRERLQDEDPGPRQERPIDLEARILGGGADEGDGAVFRGREEAVLLGLLSRWISSTKRMVWAPPESRRARASPTISRMRGTPSVTALNGTKTLAVVLATRCASVVLPLPGGPQKIIEPGTPRSTASRSGLPGASRGS